MQHHCPKDLTALPGGKRNVVFPGKGSEEILSISERRINTAGGTYS